MTHLLCFGLGFSARELAARLVPAGWTITATSRSADGAAAIRRAGYRAFVFDGAKPLPPETYDGVTHVLSSAPPDDDGDPVLRHEAGAMAAGVRDLAWAGYLSTTGVYGDHGGGWVDENTPLTPNTTRGERRVIAERQWLALHAQHGLPVHVFRLAGIYGPGRNQLLSVLDGSAKRIVKPGQVFSRIHVEDIATILQASIAKPSPGRCYNVCDDEAAPPQDVVEFAARLLGRPVPPEIPFDAAMLTPMARSFYADSKRVSNDRIKNELGVVLRYPSFRQGLTALARDLSC